ncbi:MAG: DUF433 domain-containing protein [Nostoc sp. CmiVER01]|uniref:DUF433 domain-containing protein n=1 Tax=Nostoc sp. CmiVER01 TaxID=3075384 RepID=UPI002ADA294F|nr:DUF433 domain-containing protein [Nostoc sp. CmiVER01]
MSINLRVARSHPLFTNPTKIILCNNSCSLVGVQIMDWQQYIHSDPKILLGKPTVKVTRFSVEFLLGLFAAGWTEQQVVENYPTLTPEALRAVFAFTAECMREESFL